MKTVFRPLALALLLVGTVMASACGRGKPVPTAPEPPVAAEATPAAPAAPATPAPTLPQPKPVAYKVEGGADAWHGVGIVCDFSKPFQLKGGGLTVVPTSTTAPCMASACTAARPTRSNGSAPPR